MKTTRCDAYSGRWLQMAARAALFVRAAVSAMRLVALWFAFSTLALDAATLAPPINDPAAGEKLARELRAIQPSENAEFTGSLKLSKTNHPDQSVAIKTKVVAGEKEWR